MQNNLIALSVASPEPPPVFDESALAQDLVRLLGAELQRVKRELVEARTQIEKLESSASASRPSADEANGSLLEENEALKRELQKKRDKYKEAKEANKVLRVKLEEYAEREAARPVALPTANGNVDESELNELQKQTVLLKSQLQESDNYAKDLLRQMEEMKKDKAETDQALEDTTQRLRKYECNSPWSYIQNWTSSDSWTGNLQIQPFSGCSTIHSLLQNLQSDAKDRLGSNMSKLFIRPQTEHLIWSEKKPQHCISIEPAFLYKPGGKGGHVWGVHKPMPNETDGEAKELLYQCNSHWYYCGTYKISVVHTWENGKFFSKLDHQDQISILRRTVLRQELVPPIVQDLIKSLYETGILHIVCTVYERVGYDEDLHGALQRLGDCRDGPVLDPQTPWSAATSRKRKANDLELGHRRTAKISGQGKQNKKWKQTKARSGKH